ncbi:hypothetical protein [Pedobacter sp. GR22-10]|uniref:hypothetical protein n=1 Tax=Pedobacter sp. GR22-10 TaxID=2994472 RepID=UPI0022470258|nr:hypothetical protein [Pedobacter sp. GR22-10]MCX2433390.1 hypothetical protein [Pedobacter sp. GR22-10]
MKYLTFMLIGMTIISCKSQTNTDLLSLKFGVNLSSIIQKDKELKKGQDPNLGLLSYTTNKLDNYTIGSVKLLTYAFPNGNLADYNNLTLFITDKIKNNYLGFKYNSVNQEETKSILDYLKKTYPDYIQSDKKESGESYFWEISTLNAWIFSYQSISIDKNNNNFFSTDFILVKKGTRMENSKDPKVITIKEYYKMMYPDLLK